MAHNSPSNFADSLTDYELQLIQEALHELRYGTVDIIVQDGVVVQIDRPERRRLRPANANGRPGSKNC